MSLIYIGIFAFGLFCLIRPDYLIKRKNKKDKKEDAQIDPKDIRFYRIFGVVVMALMVGALAIDLLM